MTPVDFSSSFIARMATERFKSGIGKIFHLINSNALSWNQVIEWMRKFGIAIEIVSFNNWIQLFIYFFKLLNKLTKNFLSYE